MTKDTQEALLNALEEITRCAKIVGPVGTWAYLISDSRMDAAIDAVKRVKGEQ